VYRLWAWGVSYREGSVVYGGECCIGRAVFYMELSVV